MSIYAHLMRLVSKKAVRRVFKVEKRKSFGPFQLHLKNNLKHLPQSTKMFHYGVEDNDDDDDDRYRLEIRQKYLSNLQLYIATIQAIEH